MYRLAWVSAFFLMIVALPARGEIDPYKSLRTHYTDLFNVKVYNSHSKSYFEMKRGTIVSKFQTARAYARSQSFKGVRGRLAVIDSKETQQFISRIFQPYTETWIGLRLTCRPRRLIWITGKEIDRAKDYTNWGAQWHYERKYLPCKGSSRTGGDRFNSLFAGIALYPFRGVIRWWAIAPGHGVRRALIEYPTGKR